MKKLISLFLVLSLLICSFPLTIFAREVLMVQNADGFENYAEEKSFSASSGLYRAFGNYSNSPRISTEVVYEGNKSLCMSNISHTSASLKILNYFFLNI